MTELTPIEIRDAIARDMTEVVSIQNELVDSTTFTWTEHRFNVAERTAAFEARSARGFPTLVAVERGRIVGVATYADFRDALKWPGYRFSVEHSVNVSGSAWRGGIGKRLMVALLERAREAGIHVMVGAIDGSNQRSIDFHANLGFSEVARMPELGFKHGQWLDLVLMQKLVDGRRRR
ncbi:MAG TPA: GNAT family N-acetyltransferase [Polyangiales bacterium]|jgi:phosphinothricin acetyltransferase